jgi:hypothetical protein
MLTEFVRDLADQDRPIQLAAQERPGKPIRLRFQPTVLQGGQYRVWRDVRWTLDCETPEEAFGVRDALRALFRALTAVGTDRTINALTALVAAAQQPPATGHSGKEGAA